jgi:DNA-binding XRE family transcriptional regulator
MLAVVKTPRIDITMRGDIPAAVLEVLEECYGKKVKIEKEADDELVDVFETDWFKRVSKSMTPGKYLKNNREMFGFTQQQLGEKLGNVSRQFISDMENDRRSISKEFAKKFAKIFKTSTDIFL